MQGVAAVPNAVVPAEAWNADRLNEHLQGIDAAILAGDQDRAVTLSYTCLKGFYKAFYRAKNAGQEPPNDVLVLARWIKDHFRQNVPGYPDEVANQITSTASVIDRTRNRFGDAHFEEKRFRGFQRHPRPHEHPNPAFAAFPLMDDTAIYVTCMEKIRERINIIQTIQRGNITTGIDFLNTELTFVQFRKVLELIAFASLTANREKYAQAYADFERDGRAKRILEKIEKLNPDFYPFDSVSLSRTLQGIRTCFTFQDRQTATP